MDIASLLPWIEQVCLLLPSRRTEPSWLEATTVLSLCCSGCKCNSLDEACQRVLVQGLRGALASGTRSSPDTAFSAAEQVRHMLVVKTDQSCARRVLLSRLIDFSHST